MQDSTTNRQSDLETKAQYAQNADERIEAINCLYDTRILQEIAGGRGQEADVARRRLDDLE